MDDGDGALGPVIKNLWFVAGEAILKEEFLEEDKSK